MLPKRIYRGEPKNGIVTVENVGTAVAEPLLPWLPLCLNIRNHSDGFAYGYNGSGPAQLALAILVDLVGAKSAETLYQAFKQDVIAKLDKNKPFELHTAAIQEWLEKNAVKACPTCGRHITVHCHHNGEAVSTIWMPKARSKQLLQWRIVDLTNEIEGIKHDLQNCESNFALTQVDKA